ncbi:MAG: MoaD/ThiS family protein [Bacteroidota bacterium]|nr:MoaD/ThiS family protein [Bacteroidota bacterium]
MNIKVFGQLTDIFKGENINIENAADVNELKNRLIDSYPALSGKTFVIAVDKKIIHENLSLTQNAEIALLPPFSGG